MVKISYTCIKKQVFRETERENFFFIISFRNGPTRITNVIINTANIARLF